MPAFERKSPHYLWDALPDLFVRIEAIEPPPMDYEGLDHVRMVSVLHAIVSGTALPPVEVEEHSRSVAALFLPRDFSIGLRQFRPLGGWLHCQ